MTETPNFLNSTYTSSTIDWDSCGLLGRSTTAIPYGGWNQEGGNYKELERYLVVDRDKDFTPKKEKKMAEATYKYRIVQVFVVDTNCSLPADKAILYRGEQHFTDATDQELFFELDIKGLLEEHNKTRVTYKDKKKSTGVEQVMLEPARVRDLTMNIVDVARF